MQLGQAPSPRHSEPSTNVIPNPSPPVIPSLHQCHSEPPPSVIPNGVRNQKSPPTTNPNPQRNLDRHPVHPHHPPSVRGEPVEPPSLGSASTIQPAIPAPLRHSCESRNPELPMPPSQTHRSNLPHHPEPLSPCHSERSEESKSPPTTNPNPQRNLDRHPVHPHHPQSVRGEPVEPPSLGSASTIQPAIPAPLRHSCESRNPEPQMPPSQTHRSNHPCAPSCPQPKKHPAHQA